ncbi:hypothetical protein K438DRAFT_1638995 [Mycena galopus ATCC 62051]|nr:hypothetical protein K438DRAFT_1638995 [Mycena galopus ATCC 62051]
MGNDWNTVVDLWWGLEEKSGFATTIKSHPTAKRPKAVGVWVKNARKNVPDIDSAEAMDGQWWAWWKAINPGWRVLNNELVQLGDGDWEVLRCPGQNGFLNILMCLKWWFGSMETPSESWERAIDDVKWALTQMVGR